MALHATVKVYFSPTTDPLAAPSWVEVTSYVRSWQVRRGRTSESERFPAGTATVVLENTDRRFDPLYAAGPYYGNLKANRRLRITETYSGTEYEVFEGFVDGWPQAYSNSNKDATVTVSAADAFKLFARQELAESVYADEVLTDTPRAWYRLGDTRGTVVTDSSGNGYHAEFNAGHSTDEFATSALIEGTSDGGALVPFDGVGAQVHIPIDACPRGSQYSIELWQRPYFDQFGTIITFNTTEYNRVSVTTASTGSSQPLKWYGPDTLLFTSDANGPVVARHANHIVCTRNGATLTVYLNGAALAGTTTGAGAGDVTAAPGLLFGIDGSNDTAHDEIAIYDTALSSARVSAHYEAGVTALDGDTTDGRIDNILDMIDWPAGERTLDAGISLLGPAKLDGNNALDYLQKVADTEQGRLFVARDGNVRFVDRYAELTDSASTTVQAVFSDDGSDKKYSNVVINPEDERELVNDVSVSRDEGTPVVVTDATSITTYGRRRRSVQTMCRGDNESRGLAEWVLLHHANPRTRVDQITIKPERDPSVLYPAILAREIGHRIKVERTPQAVGSQIGVELIIEGIEHTGTPGSRTSTLFCSPAETGTYWKWGTGTWGTSAIPAY